jgi:hypothetical protein
MNSREKRQHKMTCTVCGRTIDARGMRKHMQKHRTNVHTAQLGITNSSTVIGSTTKEMLDSCIGQLEIRRSELQQKIEDITGMQIELEQTKTFLATFREMKRQLETVELKSIGVLE